MSILIEKNLQTQEYSRQQLRKVKDVPLDMLESVLEKTEIITSTRRARQLYKAISLAKSILIVGVVSAVMYNLLRSTDDCAQVHLRDAQRLARRNESISAEMDAWITDNQEWLQDYFDESSEVTYKTISPEKLEIYRDRVAKIIEELEIPDVSPEENARFIESKTLNMVADVLLYIKKKKIIKFAIYLFFFISSFGIYFSSMFMKIHIANINKNISTILSLENQNYFCKKGYYWSIDEKMTTLKLSKIYIRVGRRKTNEQAPKQKVQVVSLQISRSDSGNTPKQDQKDGSNEEMQMQVRERSRSPAPRHTQLQQPYNPYMMYMQPGMHHHIGQMHPQFNPTFQHIPQMHLSGHPGQQGQLSHPGLPGHPYAPYYHYATQANFDIHNNIHHHTPPHDGEALEHDNANDDGQDAGDTEAFSDSYCDDSKPQAANQIPSKHRSHNRSRKGGQRVMTYAFTHRSDA